MKRILFIAPHSFPIKSSESICNAKVAYCLAAQGYKVDVYTCEASSTYPPDKDLNNYLASHPNLKITTIKSDYLLSRKQPLKNFLRAILFNLKILLKTGYFYNGISIPYLILSQVLKDVAKEGNFNYDAMITRGFHTDLVGVTLAKKFNVRWIANWNDPYPIAKFPFPYGKGYEAKLPFFENRLYKDIQLFADIHTFPNPRLRDYMLSCFKLINKNQTSVIPHMAMQSLFRNNTNKSGKLILIHCGDLKSPRSPKNFLYALNKFAINYPTKKHMIECRLIGGIDSDIPTLIKKLNLEDIIITKNGLSYQDALTEISQSTISLIIEAQCEEGIYLPTKVVDSLQCGIPLFAISPLPGVLNDLIRNHEIGYFAHNTSIDDIYSELCKLVDDFENNRLPLINHDSCPEIFDTEIVKNYKNILS